MIIVKSLAIFVMAYLSICLYFYYFQEKQIFFPPPSSHISKSIPAENRILLEINGLKLEGIFSGKLNNEKPLIVYFGGNAENVSYNYRDFISQLNAQFIAINYRGFAGNEGKPTIDALLQDTETILKKITTDFSVEPSNIFLMGKSFGTAIAVQLSKKEEYGGIILVSPFDSLANIAKHHFPWLPVSLLLKHPLDSLMVAKESSTPVLILAADNDQIIPASYSYALHDAWSSTEKEIILIENTRHNTIQNAGNYFQLINGFVDAPLASSHN